MSGRQITRCSWPATELDIEYHDREWGVPVHDDRTFFEFLTLEGAQAGLSWSTILKKRGGYRDAFAGFEPAKVARFTVKDVERLMQDASIVRHRQKIESTIGNAKAFLALREAEGSFDAYVWRFVGGSPMINRRRGHGDIPARTAESDALSKDLLTRGFKFVGSTICQAFMQATGLVNDHVVTCFRYAELTAICAAATIACTPAADRNAAKDTLANTATNAAAASQEDAWQVRPDGAGALSIGMTAGAARRALSLPDRATAHGCSYLAGAPQSSLHANVMLTNDTVARIDVRDSLLATVEGARVGDSEARVRQLYSGRVVAQPHKYLPDGHYLVISAPGDAAYRIVFETDGKVVTSYRAGRLPEVNNVEGCG